MPTQQFDAITVSKSKQAAVLGHALQDQHFFYQCQVWGVKADWFNMEPQHQKLWTSLANFSGKHHRHPSVREVRNFPLEALEDQQVTKRLNEEMVGALAAAGGFGTDVLVEDLRAWASGQVVYHAVKEQISPAWAAGDIARAREAIREASVALDRIDHVGVSANHFETSAERSRGEKAERLANAEKTLPFGISFFDEALGGILCGDITLATAKTGIGKTELLANIAKTNALRGTDVGFFALEAKNREIEQRIKYSELARRYYAAHRHEQVRPISFKDWMLGQLEVELAPYEDEVCAEMDRLDHLHTFYRTHGDFTVDTMETEVSRIARDMKLIIVDHLHFIDTDSSKNENAELHGIMKRFDTLAKTFGIPILLAAHVRKSDRGRMRSLLPETEDIRGSGNVGQMAHTAIALAPCHKFSLADTRNTDLLRCWGTYMHARKSRLGGQGANRLTAVGFFDQQANFYHPAYAIGQLTDMETEWEPVERPYWAKNATVNMLPTNP